MSLNKILALIAAFAVAFTVPALALYTTDGATCANVTDAGIVTNDNVSILGALDMIQVYRNTTLGTATVSVVTRAGVTLLNKSQTASNATYQIRGLLVGTDGVALGNTLLPSNSVAQYGKIPIAGGVRVIVTGAQVPITNNWTTKFIYEK